MKSLAQEAVPEDRNVDDPHFVNNFDLWRLLAALQVAAFHIAGHLHVPGREQVLYILGHFPGVPIFFFLSGYLVSGSWERSADFGEYARRRCLRIYPGLWVCLLTATVAVYLFASAKPPIVGMAATLAAQGSVLQFYNPPFLRSFGIGTLDGSLWTIAVELQLYALLPLLFAFLRNSAKPWLHALFLLCIMSVVNVWYWKLHVPSDGLQNLADPFWLKLIGATFPPYLVFFFLGMAAYLCRERLLPLARNRFLVWLPVFFVSSLILERLGVNVLDNGISPLLAPFLGMLLLSGAYTGPKLTLKLLRRNDLSYGIYIYHMIVINVLIANGLTRSWAAWGVAMAVTFVLACASWLLVERPCLRLKRKLRGAEDSTLGIAGKPG